MRDSTGGVNAGESGGLITANLLSQQSGVVQESTAHGWSNVDGKVAPMSGRSPHRLRTPLMRGLGVVGHGTLRRYLLAWDTRLALRGRAAQFDQALASAASPMPRDLSVQRRADARTTRQRYALGDFSALPARSLVRSSLTLIDALPG